MPFQPENKRFTIAAVDNIEHNTSSTTAISSFHGTSISLIQHPTEEGEGLENTRFKQRNLSAYVHCHQATLKFSLCQVKNKVV